MSLIWDDGFNYHYCLRMMYLCVRVHTNRSGFHVSAIKQSPPPIDEYTTYVVHSSMPPPYANKYHTTSNKWQLQSISLQLKIITIYLQLQIKGQKKKQITHNFLSIKIKNKTNYYRLNSTSALLILPVFSVWLWSNRSCNIWCHDINPIIMFQLTWLGLSVETMAW